jgi:aminoglycoside phosphotransferase family enzyme
MRLNQSNPSLADIVDRLRSPESYPVPTARVEVKEAHWSWVFLTENFAYKLKKIDANQPLDTSTLESRSRNCQREVDLNRRLATNVYYGIVPITIDPAGVIRVEGEGAPIDWLVKMRRLPAERMLEWQIDHRTVHEKLFGRAIIALCKFYRQSSPATISAQRYLDQLMMDLKQSFHELCIPLYAQPRELVCQVHESLLSYVDSHQEIFRTRVDEGRVVEAHGDLRPEHICLESEPVFIDCLDFDARLRILDTASELSFLSLECDRLGAGHLTDLIWPIYREICQDKPDRRLLHFYFAFHASIRAMVSVWHLKDPNSNRDKWIERGHSYLKLAESRIQSLSMN